MSFSDFSKVETLKQLNSLLNEKSYVAGYVSLFSLGVDDPDEQADVAL